MKETDKRLNVAFVGGGPGCKAIMELILCDRFSELKMNILGVASRNPGSPGAVYAKNLGIYLTSDYRDFYGVDDLDLIIEVTGSDEVLQQILKTKPPRVKVMDHVSARLFWDFMQVEERYRGLYDNAPDMYHTLNKEGVITECNQAWVRKTGYSKREIIGQSVSRFYSEKSREDFQKEFPEIIKRKKIAGIERELITKEGRTINVMIDSTRVLDRDGHVVELRSIMGDTTARKRAEEELRRSHNLLDSISRAQSQYILDADPHVLFDDLLRDLLSMTQSEYGFIGEVLYASSGDPYLKTHAITNIAWNKETQEFYDKHAPTGLEFYNLNTLFGAVMTTGKPVIANDPSMDPRRGGLPEGHPPLNTFLGLPFHSGEKLVGMVGIANRPGGYDEELVKCLQPLLSTCANIIESYRNEQRRKRTEEVLDESAKKYKILTESSLTGIFIHQDGKYVFVNDRFAQIHGYKSEELLRKDYLTLIHPDERGAVKQKVSKRLKGEAVPQRYEIKRLRKDGKTIWCEIMVTPIQYSGRPAIMGNIIDITERMQAEETLRYLKEYNEKIVASIPSSLLVLDRNLKIKSVNRTYLETGAGGIKDEDVVGKNIKEVFPGHLLKEGGLLKAFEEVMETKEPFRLHNVRHTSTHHPEKMLNFTVTGIRVAEEEEEEEATLILVIEDVTERARLTEEIRKSKDFMDTIFKTSVDIVVTTDESGIITFANRAAEKFLGYNEEELVDRHVSVLYDRGRERAKDMMAILTSGQELRDYRMRFLTREGKEIPISVSGSLLKDSQGRVIGTLGFVRDVSRLVEAEEEIRKKNEELENFVYVVSHDLKSPIVSMQWFSSMLLNEYREKLGEEGERYIERIRANASRMEVLISDLLALSRVGRVVGAFKDVSSLEIVSRVCEALKSRIEENRVKVSISNDLPVVHCDEVRIYQIFENLIVNAIKFMGDTEEPRIEIGYEEKGEFHQFYVRDNGIGIDPKYHRKIFEIFQRLKEIDDEEGTGIGLVIVERVVKNHGGEVWVESEKGAGATFYFTLQEMPSQNDRSG